MTISSGMPMRASASSSKASASIASARRQRMEIEIDQRRGDIFDRGKALVESARGEQPLQQFLRHRLAGLVMQGEAPQHFRLLEPVLVELRRQLDEIGGDAGAGDHRIGDVGEQAVQRVAEFVEQRAGVVEAQQRRLAVGALVKFITLTTSGRMSPASFSWSRSERHPGAAALGRPREIIAEEQADVRCRRASRTSQTRTSGCQTGTSCAASKLRPNSRCAV